MKREDFEQQFLDYIEDRLDPAEKQTFEAALLHDQDLKRSFDEYSRVMNVERAIAAEGSAPHASFTAKVMNTLESGIEADSRGFFERLSMLFTQHRRMVVGSVATLATLTLVIRLSLDAPYAMRAPASSILSVPAKPLPGNYAAPEVDAESSRRQEVTGGAMQPVVPQVREKAAAKTEQYNDLVTRFSNDTKALGEIEESKHKADSGNVATNRTAEIFKKTLDKLAEDTPSQPQQLLKERQALLGAHAFDKAIAAAPVAGAADGAGIAMDASESFGAPLIVPEPRRDFDVGAKRGLSSSTFRLREVPEAAPADESYTFVTENNPTLVRDEPVSTFSIDVDTASYANTRRFITAGQLPPPDSVRIEEFINYFDYHYPVQYEKPFTLSYEIAPSPLQPEKFLLKLGIKARDAAANQKGWNLVFLVDVSGSMSDSNKLPLLQRSLPVLVEHMRPQDRIAIVTYAGNAGLVLDSTSGEDKARIIQAIESLSSGGSTNGSGGISLAYQIAARNRIEGGVNRVILATDGDFNVGVTSQDELVRLIEQKRQSGISLTTLGVGQGNLKDGTMEKLADKGNGNYFYLDSFKEARKVLETDLVGNMQTVAKDVKLQIEFNPEHVLQYRLVGYDNRKLKNQDFNNDAIDAGEIGTGHTVTALYEVVLANTEAAKRLQDDLRYQKAATESKLQVADGNHKQELGFLKIRYKQPDGDRSALLEYPVMASDVRKSVSESTQDFRFAAAVSYFATLLKHSQYAGNYSFTDILKLAESGKGNDEKGYRQEFIELVKDARALSPSSTQPSGSAFESNE